MKKIEFVHLHFHTEYSLLDGLCPVEKAVAQALALGMPALAMTDHGVLFGAIQFFKKAKEKGLKPILGCEVYVASGSRFQKDRDSHYNHLVLLAETDEGFRNLSRLVSLAHTEGYYYKPRVDRELLQKYHGGLIALSSCLNGEVAQFCVDSRLDHARRVVGEFADIFGPGNYYIELQDHGMPEQKKINPHLIQLAAASSLPLVATNDVHYLKREHYEAHDIMLCLQTQTVRSDPKRMRYPSDQFYMKTAEEMAALFPEHPEALAHTVEIAHRCNVDLHLGKETHFPAYDLPPGETPKSYLQRLAFEGLGRRYGIADPLQPRSAEDRRAVERCHFELGVIEKTGFINYFIVVWDFIRFAREQGIPVGPGRGSGAGSLVAFALGITGIDPLKYNLIFERFLNPERISPPDFDIDFCQTRRGEVIEYVRQKYGVENVAQIVTFGSLGPKTVIRDIGRVLEIPYADCDRLSKLVPEDPKITLATALEASPEFKREIETNPVAQHIMKYARDLEGLPRNIGTHAAGVVIGEKPLIEILPLALDKDDQVITQYDMSSLDAVGLLKMDFLGLKTLTVIQETVAQVRRTRGETLDLDRLPMEDAEAFALLNRADTVGVFQVESKGMRDLLRRIQIGCFEDLSAMIALYRPGPMNMLDAFVDRKLGKVSIEHDHPLLEPILRETYGVMLYQEQVQQAANVLAGFTLGQGDMLRRAMGKKKAEEMAKERAAFVKGCEKTNKIPAEKANQIFDNIERFAGYGFNKSHSTAYAVIAWQTAYLKAHYPEEFMAALLSSEMGNADKLPGFIAEAQAMGIQVLPPNVNDSEVRFKPGPGAIRFGLAGVKNVGVGAVEAILREREARGPFRDLLDFCARVDSKLVNRKCLESLARCGAFDFCGLARGRLFSGIDFAMQRAVSRRRDQASGQRSFFDLGGAAAPAVPDALPDAPDWPESQKLSAEKELLGFYISGHPLQQFEWELDHYCHARLSKMDDVAGGATTRVGGLVTKLEKMVTKKDKRPMARFVLEGLDAALPVTVFPGAFEEFGALLAEEQPVIVCGTLERKEGQGESLLADEIYLLADAARLFAVSVSVHLPESGATPGRLEAIRAILAQHPGETPAQLCLMFSGGEKVFLEAARDLRVRADAALARTLEHLLGEETVYIHSLPQAGRRPPGSSRPRWRNGRGAPPPAE